jgi:hypothetical protein
MNGGGGSNDERPRGDTAGMVEADPVGASIHPSMSVRIPPKIEDAAVERRPTRLHRRVARALLVVATLVAVSIASIAFALEVTPERSVSALGQTVAVGTANPTLSRSGPGEVVLFGRSLPTEVEFVGPVRPRLVLTDITIDEQVAEVFGRGSASTTEMLGEELASGWRTYFAWEIAFVTLAAVVLLGAIAGWRRYHLRQTIVAVVGGVLFVQVVNLSAIMLTAYTAPDRLAQVRSLSQLVGRDELRPVPPAPGPALRPVQAVVGRRSPSQPRPTSRASEARSRSPARSRG